MSKPLALLTLAVLLGSACMPSAKSANLSGPLQCTLDSVTPAQAGGPVAVRMRLINRSEQTVWFLRWNTPFEGMRGTVFTLRREGAEIPFQGPMIKRGDPGNAEYVEIQAGESVVGTVDLAEGYDTSKPGRYQAQVTGPIHDVIQGGPLKARTRDQFQPLELRCPMLDFEVRPAT
jgi:hypothetical protein